MKNDLSKSRAAGRLAAGGSLLAGGIAGGLVLAPNAGATATTYHVTNLLDSGAGSLRAAVAAANLNSGADTIVFDAGATGTITLTSGRLEISDDVTLTGLGAATSTVSGNNASQIFYIYNANASLTVSISGLTLTEGNSTETWGGGALVNWGNDLTLSSVVVTGNESVGRGGGVFSGYPTSGFGRTAPVTIIDSEISNNTSASDGGGLGFYSLGDVTITNTTISANTASNDGGGVYIKDTGVVTMSGTVVSGNTSTRGTGGVWSKADLSITTSTFENNVSGGACGGGLYVGVNNGDISITNSTFSGNSLTGSYGGAIDFDGNYNTILIANTTITGNSAKTGGGLHIDSGNDVALAQVTIVGNNATSTDALYSGGGIHFAENLGSLTMSGTIVSGNTSVAGPDDIGLGNQGSFVGAMTANNSLLGDVDSRIDVTGSNNIDSTTPGVGVLADNGGPTKTMALLTGSAALDAGPNPVATFTGNGFDQRGTPWLRVYGTQVDIGAFEWQPDPTPSTTTTTAGPLTTTTATSEPVAPAFTG